MNNKSFIRIENLEKNYNNGDVVALKNINLQFNNSGLVMIVGKSGCGKTTLLNIIAGMQSYDGGTLCIEDKSMDKMTESNWDILRNEKIGVIFQDYALIEDISVYNNIALPLKIKDLPDNTHKLYVDEVLKYVDMAGYDKRLVNELSGGQKQRVAIARALIKNPYIILADEPTGNLDTTTSNSTMELLKNISNDTLVIVVTHDLKLAEKFADRIINICDGEVISDIENDITKEINCNSSLDIKNNLTNEALSFENSSECEIYIKNLIYNIYNKKKTTDSCNINLTVKSKNNNNINTLEQEEKKQKDIKRISKNAKSIKMKNKEILYYSALCLKKRILRYIITILMLSLTLFLFGMTTIFLTYDKDKTKEEYFKKYREKFYSIKNQVEYKDLLENIYNKDLEGGKEIKSKLEKIFASNRIFKAKKYSMVNNIPDSMGNINESYQLSIIELQENNPFIIKDIVGKIPDDYNEIAITDYMAGLLSINSSNLGCEILLDKQNVKVVGIVDTDYEEYEIAKKMGLGMISEYGSYKLNNIYEIAFVSKKYSESVIESSNTVDIPASKYRIKGMAEDYVQESMEYGSVNLISQEQIIKGRLPESNDEVIINSIQVGTIGVNSIDNAIGKECTYMNLHDEIYNGYYNDYMNFYDYFPQGVKVVGVYEANEGDAQAATVLINDNIFYKIKNDYFENFFYDKYYITSNFNNYAEDIKLISKNNLNISHPQISIIDEFAKTIKNYKMYLFFINSILAVITIFMVITTIGYNIVDNSKKLGILRSIGVEQKDTLKIFIIQAIFVSITGIVTACCLCYLGVIQINKFYMKTILENKFNILFIRWDNLSTLFLIICIICLISAVIPIKKLSKIKAINLINKN